MFDANWATLWEEVADAVPDRPAILVGDSVVTYRWFDERAARFAAALEAAGIGPGSKVAFYMFNCPEYLEAFYATLKTRATPVNVNYRYRGRELTQLLDDSDAEALLFHRSLADSVDDARTESSSLKLMVEVDNEPGPPATEASDFTTLVAENAPAPRRERSGADLIFMYTGGTTGLPKGVVWQQRDLFQGQCYPTYGVLGLSYPSSVEEAVATAVGVGDAAPRALPVTPLMHATALFTVMDGLALGGSVVFVPGRSFDPAGVLRAVEDHHATRLVIAGNAIAEPLADELDRVAEQDRPYDITSLQGIMSSGMVWSDSNKRRLLEHHPMQLVEILGSSEGGPYAYAVTTSPAGLPSRFHLAGGAKVFDDNLEEVPAGSGRIGTLAFTGPMPLGYYKDERKTASVFRHISGERFVMPGDLATLSEDGSLELLGRGSGVINSGGEKVYPGEVEEALYAHPDISDCAVFGIPHRRWGEQVTAVVQLKAGEATPAELIDHVGVRLASFKKPKAVVVLDSLRRGPNGKVDMGHIRQQAMEELGLDA